MAAAAAAAGASGGGGGGAALKSLGLQLNKDSSLICYIFIKPHQPAEEPQQQQQAGAGPSSMQQQAQAQQAQAHKHAVFVTGLPLGLGEDDIAAIFSCFGDVIQVVLHHTKRSGVAVFSDAAGAAAALAAAGTGQVIEYEPEVPEGPRGLKAWVQEHKGQRPGTAHLQKRLDEWVANWEEAEAARQRAREEAMGGDGWTVVVRNKGRKRARDSSGVATVSGGVAAAAAAAAAAEGSKADRKYEDFYRFQQRDKRRSELVELRKRFEEDRKRIADLRAARKFKPY